MCAKRVVEEKQLRSGPVRRMAAAVQKAQKQAGRVKEAQEKRGGIKKRTPKAGKVAKAQYVYKRPPLYAAQEAAIFVPERYALVEASTKSGKTVGCLVWLLERALEGKAGANYWWTAPVYAQARIAFERILRAIPRQIYRANKQDMMIRLINDTAIWFKSGDRPDTLYGEDVFAAVIDEATRLREDAWHAIRSTLTATRGPLRIIGNVRGRKNWAYRMARQAEMGAPDMHYAKITAYDAIKAGILDKDEVEDARRMLPEEVFNQLYLAEPSDDEGNPFGLVALRDCVVPAIVEDTPAAWGWDLAKHEDWTVGIALNAEGAVCGLHRWRGSWLSTVERILETIGETPTLADSTGVGDPIVEHLQARSGNVEGFNFSVQSKQRLIESLALAIQQRKIHFPEGPILAELESFEYTITQHYVLYSAPEGMNDDCVCALALAWECLRKRGGHVGEGSGFLYPEPVGFV